MKVEMNDVNRSYSPNDNFATEKKVEKAQVEKTQAEKAKDTSKSEGTTEKDTKKIKEIVDKMNKELENMDTSIEFKVHESQSGGLNKVSIKVVEKDSEKVIVEIPSEESIEFSEKMDEITGMLFDHKR